MICLCHEVRVLERILPDTNVASQFDICLNTLKPMELRFNRRTLDSCVSMDFYKNDRGFQNDTLGLVIEFDVWHKKRRRANFCDFHFLFFFWK